MVLVDVHTHLTHEKFGGDIDAVIGRAVARGVVAIVSNGLDPESNRCVLDLAKRYPVVKPALGIYPIDAVNHLLPEDFALQVSRFDVQAEIAFIRAQAAAKSIVAIGECGLDGYWVDESTFADQERVFVSLIEIALEHELPIIVHTRKLEARAIDILCHHGAKKVDLHCFGGKVRLAQKAAEQHGFWLSIPCNARKNEAFRKMLGSLPIDRVLTETDAPYLSPEAGQRNEPANVAETVALFAELRGLSVEDASQQVYRNYLALFGDVMS